MRHHFRNLRAVTNNVTHCAELEVFILNNFVWKWQIHVCFCVCIWKDQAHTIEWWIFIVLILWGHKALGACMSHAIALLWIKCELLTLVVVLSSNFPQLLIHCLPTNPRRFQCVLNSVIVVCGGNFIFVSFSEQKMLKGRTFLVKIDFLPRYNQSAGKLTKKI